MNGTQSIKVSLCGNPRPGLSYSIDGGYTYRSLNGSLLDDTTKTHLFQVKFHRVNSSLCGSVIHFNVTGEIESWNTTALVTVLRK